MSNYKSFLYYSHISVSEGLNTELKTSELCLERYDKEIYKKCGHCCQVIEIKKILKKILTLAMYVLNFYKKKTKWIRLFMLFGKRIQNIGSFQTYIVFMSIKYLEQSHFRKKWKRIKRKNWHLYECFFTITP